MKVTNEYHENNDQKEQKSKQEEEKVTAENQTCTNKTKNSQKTVSLREWTFPFLRTTLEEYFKHITGDKPEHADTS